MLPTWREEQLERWPRNSAHWYKWKVCDFSLGRPHLKPPRGLVESYFHDRPAFALEIPLIIIGVTCSSAFSSGAKNASKGE